MNGNSWKPSRLTTSVESVSNWKKGYGVAYMVGGGLLLTVCGAMGAQGLVGIGFCAVTWPLSFAIPMFIAALAEEIAYSLRRAKRVPPVWVVAWTTTKHARWFIAGYIIMVALLAISFSLQPDWWDSTKGSGELRPEDLTSDQNQANFNFWLLLSLGLVGLLMVGTMAGIWAGLSEQGPQTGWVSPAIMFIITIILNGYLIFGWVRNEGDPLIWPDAARILTNYCLIPIIVLSTLFYGASRLSVYHLRQANEVIGTSSHTNRDS